MTWRSPDTYHLAGHGRGTATLKFYEGRDILDTSGEPVCEGADPIHLNSYALEEMLR